MGKSLVASLAFVAVAAGLWFAKDALRERFGTKVPAPDPAEAPTAPASRPGAALRDLLASRAAQGGEPTLPDPDGVGPLPALAAKVESPVIRRGRDGDGFATWWHADGSLTKRVEQTLRDAEGRAHKVPSVIRVAPGAGAPAATQRPR